MFACLAICREYKTLNYLLPIKLQLKKHDRISLIVGHFYIIKIIILKNRNNLWRSDIFLDQIEEEIKLTDLRGRLFNTLF